MKRSLGRITCSLLLASLALLGDWSLAQSTPSDVYDASGRLVQTFDAQRNIAIQYVYDEQGRLVREIHSDGTIIEHGAPGQERAP